MTGVKVTDFDVVGPLLIEPAVYRDDRGYFAELWNHRDFVEAVETEIEIAQINTSRSGPGVLRGLHYQLPPDQQGKLVWVARGSVWDVAVDVRRSSPTFGEWVGVDLDDSVPRLFWIPPGFAHGFLVAADGADVVYAVTAPHAPGSERSVRWDDSGLSVDWPLGGRTPVVSQKDAAAPGLADAEVFR